ncbi:heavy metal translocating P-type ATPase metal-binding domain-containing protein [Craurococcus roseus]|uniref:Heavy metal translocating P-type ATPase metal-binding domain-containing protein n=1 Tax=Craurococcus roseus TaxID=77585 RepID=A0ABN1FR09_9PROT
MSHIRPVPPPSAVACAHCGAPVPPGADGTFCCAGCAGAHAIVAGLGLDAFYSRLDPGLAAASLRPAAAAPDTDFAVRATRPEDTAGTTHSLDLLVPGLRCGACVWLLEEALAAEPDVLRARASLADRRLRLVWRGPAERAAALAALPARLGFGVAPWSAACLRAAEDAEGRALLSALGVAAFGAANVMLLSVAMWFGGGMGEGTRWWLHALTAAIALPTIAVAGLPFYRGALAGLRVGRATMDLAVSLGVLATAAMSLSEALRNGPYTWFDGATSLLALLLAGRVLDRAARRRALGAVSGLLALAEGEVALLASDGTARTAPAADARPGDRVLVAPGERLRLDGVLETPADGASPALLDLSAVTGEAMPQPAAAGQALPAGAVNLGAGALVVRVTAAAADGSLAALARLVRRAEAERGRLGDLADRAAALYVPAVHAVAAGTFLLWWLLLGAGWREALVPAVAVLIVTCPCGLAIAVPAARAVATGALFRRGVLVASGSALERLAEADHAVLDKTGTLTEGRPSLLPDPARPDGALFAAAALARCSRHPLSRALAEACPDAPAAPGVEEVPGAGLRTADGARLGSAAFVGIDAPEAGDAAPGPVLWWRAAPGAAPVAFRFADPPRPDAAEAVSALRRLGLAAEILSGDSPGAVSAVAAAVGVEEWRAGASPADKATRIEALQAEGRRPLMVGDGINDAAAMALAHASASPGGGADLAQDTADFVLRGGGTAGGLLPMAEAVSVARRSRRIARQSLGFSLAYNLVAVPAAVAGLVTPLGAAVVMATSSLAVIGNALRAGR